ncbi:GntR family transcriptional regulator [Rubellimicrobium arenae]|uniref:GntR family transcriptional regulator n=1 Tax=Rubellimicrobium arenae TaxID=2817372 RepID=UPI001B315477|nr:GntR family transcriptional regulator [Rubellimicrobium arenae]
MEEATGQEPRSSLAIAPEARQSLRGHVHQQLRMAIISGRLPSGQRLNERLLAEEMEISTTPLKEALRQLEAEGLVEVLPRRGVVVRFDASFAEEMILARAALESPIAALAAERVDDDGRARLGATVQLMREATEAADIARLILLNETFHGAIHAASGSRHLTRMVAQQQFYDGSARRVIHRDAGESRLAFEEHKGIAEAIIAGQPQEASARMSAHVLRSGRLYLTAVFGR